LGLFLLLAEQPQAIAESPLPDWVTEWVAARSQKAEKQAEKQAKQQEQAADPAAQAKRAAERQRKVSAGVQELRLWLEDRVRQGLVTLQQGSYQVWDTPAARMVDAQAPGLARHLREMAGIPLAGRSNWMEQLLERFGRLYLLLEGHERLDSLPEPVQADIRNQVGWTVAQEEVLSRAGQHDLWLVLGQRTEEEERLRTRRTWLLGLSSGKPALLLDFAHGNQPFEQALLPGTCLEAELVFYPSAYPLRALIKTRQEAALVAKTPPGYRTIAAAIAAYSTAFTASPWLERFPLLLQDVIPVQQDDRWLLRDSEATVLPLSAKLEPNQCWQLRAISGGYPLTLFGEWNGMHLSPLSVWLEDTFYGL
jgi:hypothetical protein